MKIIEESLVLASQEPARLRRRKLAPGSLRLYRLDDGGETVARYEEGKDFTCDYAEGTVLRTPDSEIPDFAESCFYQKPKFDHNDYSVWGNKDYILCADYRSGEPGAEESARTISEANGQRGALAAYLGNFGKSAEGKALRLLVFGDSISTGAEAFPADRQYFNRFAKLIEERYHISVALENASVGGDTSEDGMRRFKRDVLPREFDLVILGFGMNDQNQFGEVLPVTPGLYEKNLREMILALRDRAQIVLLSPCAPNPDWYYRSGRQEEYVERQRALSAEFALPLADVNALWRLELERKSPWDLLRNGINHPTNYGHYLYSLMLGELI